MLNFELKPWKTLQLTSNIICSPFYEPQITKHQSNKENT